MWILTGRGGLTQDAIIMGNVGSSIFGALTIHGQDISSSDARHVKWKLFATLISHYFTSEHKMKTAWLQSNNSSSV